MGMTRTTTLLLRCSLFVILLQMPSWTSTAQAESCVAGQSGVPLPSIGKGLSDIDLTGSFVPRSTTSDQTLKSSVLFGAKVGHYFKAVPWFGVEAAIYHTTPHIKQQSIEFSGPGGIGNSSGREHARPHDRTAKLQFPLSQDKTSAVRRYRPRHILRTDDDPSLTSDNSQSSTKLGLNAQAGLRYYITRRLTVFGEGKYNYVRFSFPETPPGSSFNLFGFNGTHNVPCGLRPKRPLLIRTAAPLHLRRLENPVASV